MTKISGLESVDIAILIGYFVLVLGGGLYLSKKASQGISEYFLGGRSIPWWAIGMSGTASNFDMTGTMVIISFFYAIGLQGFWVSMRGGMGLPIGILMAFMAMWLRRSNVMTTAEWMKLRFGGERQGKVARLLSAISNLIVTMAFLVYFVKGTGKFLAIFLPFSPEVCALMMIAVALIYTTLSGFYGVIYTDVLQEILIIGVSVYVGYQAFNMPEHAQVMSFVGQDWLSFMPQWEAKPMEWLANPDLYQAFGFCVVFWIARGVFEGAGGGTGGYMTQRFYAAKNDREAGLLTAEWIVLLFFRWSLIIGIVLLGLQLALENSQIQQMLAADPEKTLPIVISEAVPGGIRGILVAGLIAAAMSTFDSTINAGVSYWVRDIYQQWINPKANNKQLMRQSYGATVAVTAVAILIAMSVSNINEIWSWITGPLSAGLFVPIILRWFWWRLNGYGFAISTLVGLVASVIIKLYFAEMPFYWSFIITMFASLVGGVAGSLLTKPTSNEVLVQFWRQIRPFGFWSSIRTQLDATFLDRELLKNSIKLLNAFFCVAWHLSGVVGVISLLLHKWVLCVGAWSLFAVLTYTLYFTWYKNLQTKEEAAAEEMELLEGA